LNTSPVLYLGWPIGNIEITIPKATPLGTTAVLQAFGFNTKAGNLTNILDLRIR
jgi:hypothetical protein